ncbi:MAG TPA: hypothetical protein VM432_10860, partial [Bdellovibrionales bacterium]|nr:hypothetical protein [Bdellovibrionales bacterium]
TKLDAAMSEGNLNITQLSFGGTGDPLSGKVNGQVVLSFRRENAGVTPVIGGYDLNVDLLVKREFMAAYGSRFGIVFGLLKGKRETPQGTRFAFKAAMKPGMTFPEITAQ